MISLSENATGISVMYETDDGKRGSFVLDFTDPRSLFSELEKISGWDFSHQVEKEFYNWKEQLEDVPMKLAIDLQDIIFMISDVKDSVSELNNSTDNAETKSALDDISEQLDTLTRMVKESSAWSDEINYILTGKGIND